MLTPANRRGFTLIELMISLVLGLIVLASANSVVVSTFRAQSGAAMSEETARNARFLGEILYRDLAESGVELPSTSVFGSVDVRNDTVSVLSVPFEPDAAPRYRFEPPVLPAGTSVPPNCGATCITVRTDGPGNPIELAAGDVARLQSTNMQRLILIQSVTGAGVDLFNVTFANVDSILHRASASVPPGGLLLFDRAGTTIRKLAPVIYWREGSQVMRASRLDPVTVRLLGEPVVDSVRSFDVSLVFLDGDELDRVSGTDADLTNDYDQIASIRIRGRLESLQTNPRVNAGAPADREFDWRFSPRNLRYERQRT